MIAPALSNSPEFTQLCVGCACVQMCVCARLWDVVRSFPVRALFTQWGPFHTFGSPARLPVCFSHINSSPLPLWLKKPVPFIPSSEPHLVFLPLPSLHPSRVCCLSGSHVVPLKSGVTNNVLICELAKSTFMKWACPYFVNIISLY